MKQAKIKCPCCDHQFIVRMVEPGDSEREAAIWKAADEMWAAMDRLFKAAFSPLFKR